MHHALRQTCRKFMLRVVFKGSKSVTASLHAETQTHNQLFASGKPLDNLSSADVPQSNRNYQQVFEESLRDPEQFWSQQAQRLTWFAPWTKVLDQSDKIHPKWFEGGQYNITYDALDRHVRHRPSAGRCAIKYDSPVMNVKESITYLEVYEKVGALARAFAEYGVRKGDCIVIYMGMIPEAIIAMLACARIGAVHSLVFGGFPAKTLATRIKHAVPKLIVTANGAIERDKEINYKTIVDEALALAGHEPKHVIVYNRLQLPAAALKRPRDLDFIDVVDKYYARPHEAVPVDSMHPLYVIYTSGTTGEPKGIVRPAAGYAVALNWSMESVYGIRPGETWWAASDLGWVVGHSYVCYAPLLNGSASVLYEGKPVGTPDPSAYFRVIAEHGVVANFVAPTALRAIRKEDPDAEHAKRYVMDNFRLMHVAGEHLDHETRAWAINALGGNVPVLDHWWQTETGWPITAVTCGLRGVSTDPPSGASGRPVPGFDVRVVDDKLNELPPNKLGQIVIKLPLPPGCMSTLYKNDKKFVSTYYEKYPGYYDSMDSGHKTEDGYISVMSRTDDVINVSGVRLSTSAIEEAVLEHAQAAECAVVGVKDSHRGQVPLVCLVLSSHKSPVVDGKPDESFTQLKKDITQTVRNTVGSVASLRAEQICIVSRLPKTRSGKIARQSIADLANGKQITITPTIEDADAYKELKKALQQIGYAVDAPDPVES